MRKPQRATPRFRLELVSNREVRVDRSWLQLGYIRSMWKSELTGSFRETNAGDGRRTPAHGDREPVSAELDGEAIGVTVKPQRCTPDGPDGWVAGRALEVGCRGPDQPPSHTLAAPTAP